MVKRFLFKRVEQWINGLEPEYRNKGFISASLRLLGILGLPTDFSTVVVEKKQEEQDIISSLNVKLNNLSDTQYKHIQRQDELLKLEELLG